MIKEQIQKINDKGRKVLSVFLTAGFPEGEKFTDTAMKIIEAGADMLEIGIPFSYPLADGAVIQRSSEIALKQGINTHRVLELTAKLREKTEIPLILMGYANPILNYGKEKFFEDALSAGANGVIIPDVPIEEYDDFFGKGNHSLNNIPEKSAAIFFETGKGVVLDWDLQSKQSDTAPLVTQKHTGVVRNLQNKKLDTVLLVTPQSGSERIKLIDEKSSGFVYCVSVSGTTGARESFSESDLKVLARTAETVQKNKLLVGFGISNGKTARQVLPFCNGVIVGSAVIKKLQTGGIAEATELVKELRAACSSPAILSHSSIE